MHINICLDLICSEELFFCKYVIIINVRYLSVYLDIIQKMNSNLWCVIDGVY
jgi:hypothetical protein